jgi:hypothetical protein
MQFNRQSPSPFVSAKTRLLSVFIVTLALTTACTYGPVRERVEIVNGWLSTDAKTLYVAVRQSSFREPTGLAAFPDGGKERLVARELRIFRVDLPTGTIALVKVQPALDTEWETLLPSIWSVTPEGVYVLFTGCPKGGECYPSLSRRTLYFFNLLGGKSKAGLVEEPARNAQPDTMAISIHFDQLDIWARYEKKLLYRFRFDSKSGMLKAERE